MRLNILPITAALALLALSACGEGDAPRPSPATAQPISLATSAPPPTTGTPRPTASPPPTPATSLFSSPPTQEDWITQRLAAVADLYDISDEGRDLFDRLDVRQMRGEPGFFGSYGYKSWTGVGEAKPSTIMHELGHAYWGAFPVTGFPGLTWEKADGQALPPAMERYHQDVLAFMRQPPGHYELYRSRLRNIPELSAEKLDGLFHSVEADVVYDVAGDLELLPPILRKYWDRLLRPGRWGSWYDAVAWFRGLDDNDRSLTGRLMGFEHLDLREYTSLPRAEDADITDAVKEILEREEQQRLWDFADQFDLLLGEPQYQENFGFWRGYLGAMKTLHGRHPGFLQGLDLPRARDIANALDLLLDLDGESPQAKAHAIMESLPEQPFILHFLPTLDNQTLLELIPSQIHMPEGATLTGTASFVQRLQRFSPTIDLVMAAAGESTEKGAAELTRFYMKIDFDNKDDLKLFLGLLRDADHDRARSITAALDDEMTVRVLKAAPAELHSLLDPKRLLEALSIAPGSSAEELTRGIDLLITYPSGNFRIDEPYLEALFDVMAARVDTDPAGSLAVIEDTPFPMKGFLRGKPRHAVAALNADLDVAARLVRDSDPVLFPPARFVYTLINADPDFAATLVAHLDRLGGQETVLDSLIHFAYDADRLDAVPNLPISLENDGLFLAALLEAEGAPWLETRLHEVIDLYQARINRGDIPPDLLHAYLRTLNNAIATLPDDPKHDLTAIVGDIFR